MPTPEIPGALTPAEGAKLAELAAGGHCLEIGSLFGRSASYLARTARKVVCVDHFVVGFDWHGRHLEFPIYHDFRRNLADHANIVAVCMHSEKEADAAAEIIAEGIFDLVFIDAGHSYEDVRRDIARWLPKVRSGGMAVFHDYDNPQYPGVRRAVDESGMPEGRVEMLAWRRCR